MKLQKSKTGQFWITIPSQLVRAMQWEKGQEVKIVVNNQGNLELRGVKR